MHPQRGDLGPPEDEPGVHTFEIDPGVYLPEGVELADDDPETDGPGTDGDPSEPFDPADSTDPVEPTDSADPADPADPAEPDDAAGSVEPVGDDSVDTSVLERIEGELDEVDAALAAIDAGRPESSALLHRLLEGAEGDPGDGDSDDGADDPQADGAGAGPVDPLD